MTELALSDKDIGTLVKMLRMLGAPSVGERAVAALKVSEWVSSRGLDWADLILPEPPLPEVEVGVADEPEGYRFRPPQPQQGPSPYAQAFQAAMNAQQAQYNPYANQGLGAGLGSGLGAAAAQAAAGGFQARNPVHATVVSPGHPVGAPGPGVAGNDGRLGGVVKDWRTAAGSILRWHHGVLRGAKEEQFVQDQFTKTYQTLTGAQEKWLRDICARANLSWVP